MKAVLKGIGVSLKATWWAVVIATPIVGVWLASTLAVYLNGPIWAAIVSGALLFPGIPLVWDIWSSRRHESRQLKRETNNKERKDRWLSIGDRMVLRTLVINLLFVATLLALFPRHAFTALSTPR